MTELEMKIQKKNDNLIEFFFLNISTFSPFRREISIKCFKKLPIFLFGSLKNVQAIRDDISIFINCYLSL